MNSFKKIYGMTPTEYRRSHRDETGYYFEGKKIWIE